MDDFKLELRDDKLFVVVVVKGVRYEQDVTDYFSVNNPFDDWLDVKLGLK